MIRERDEDVEYEEREQRGIDDRAEAEAKRAAAGLSAEQHGLMNALIDGQRAGHMDLPAGANPHKLGTDKYAEWERARSAVEGAKRNGQRRVA